MNRTENGEAHARRMDPSTSHEAADSMAGTPALRLEDRVAEALRRQGNAGATKGELMVMTDLPDQTLTPRLRPLERKGIVFRVIDPETEKFESRVDPVSGRRQAVWRHRDFRAMWEDMIPTVSPDKKVSFAKVRSIIAEEIRENDELGLPQADTLRCLLERLNNELGS